MPQIRFKKTVGVEGVMYQDGQVADLNDIPKGARHSLVRLDAYDIVDEPAADATDVKASEPAAKKAK